jgi:hypothetical protein
VQFHYRVPHLLRVSERTEEFRSPSRHFDALKRAMPWRLVLAGDFRVHNTVGLPVLHRDGEQTQICGQIGTAGASASDGESLLALEWLGLQQTKSTSVFLAPFCHLRARICICCTLLESESYRVCVCVSWV